jgi:hypothetical protein
MRVFLLIGLLLFSACGASSTRHNPNDPDGNLVEYQFIDADTMKPIKDAYANVVWVTPTPPGKINGSKCVRAALLRSDANGWVKMDGPKGSIIDLLNLMVPGYEDLKLTYELEPTQTVHVLRVSHDEYERFPAWGKSLQSIGYQLIDIKENSDVVFRKNYNQLPKSNDAWSFTGAQRYFVKLRSFPSEAASSFPNIGNACGPEGENIGLSESQRLETGTRRGIAALDSLCDAKWDSVSAKIALPSYEIAKALWLVKPPADGLAAWAEFQKIVPTYQGVYEGGPALNRDERLEFCSWMQPYAEKYR